MKPFDRNLIRNLGFLFLLMIPVVSASTVWFEYLVIDDNMVKIPHANCSLNVTNIITDATVLNSVQMYNRTNGFQSYNYSFDDGLYVGEIHCFWSSSTARDAFGFEVNETEFRYTQDINETLHLINQTHSRYLEYINESLDTLNIDVGGGGTGYQPCPMNYKSQKDDSGGTWCVPKSQWERFIDNNKYFLIMMAVMIIVLWVIFEGKFKKRRDEYLERKE